MKTKALNIIIYYLTVMISLVESLGARIYKLGSVAMEEQSLLEHLQKHSDIATTPEEYLATALEVLEKGRPYKNGKLYKGIFLRGYPSQELGAYIVNTVHKRF